MAKSNLPLTLTGEQVEFERLYKLNGQVSGGRNMTTTGAYSFTSPSSSTVYETTDGGEYAVFLQLQTALENYDISADDFNLKMYNYHATSTGSANTYVVTYSPAPTAYTDGMMISVKINVDSTSDASTINVNSLGAKFLVDVLGNNILLKTNGIYTFRFNSLTDKFILQGGSGSGGGLSITSPQLWAL